LNAAWHEKHPLAKRATLAQRIAWHREHEQRCGCRPMPAKLRTLLSTNSENGKGRTPRYVAFLRGVSPMNAKMPELKRCFEAAGFSDVKTVLGSGNVVFGAKPAPEAQLAEQAEVAMQRRLERPFLTIVRSVAALEKLLASDPFAAHRLAPDEKRVVTFLKGSSKAKIALPVELGGARILSMKAGAIFTAYRPSPRSAVFMALIERTFGKEITTRTWETVQKVVK
jgi:uncharacterized protein (DUF1697 family)